jgi:hypothetical protein
VGKPVTYTATVAPCTTQHEHVDSEGITATYSGDSNYAGSSGSTSETVDQAPTIISADETTFTLGAEGSFTVQASGTPTPTLSEQGRLPAGVKFDPSTGTLSGTPIEGGVYPITFTAENGVGSTAVQSFTLTVDAPPLITSPDEATFTGHGPSSFTVTAAGAPVPTITKWGNLPAGVHFAAGALSGTPTESGTFEITFTASNGIGSDSIQMFQLTVLGLRVTTSSLPAVTPGVPYSQQLTATGGIAPYKWKVSAHGLPKGLHLSSAGVLSGKVSAKAYPQGGSFPLTVTDSSKPRVSATAPFTIDVA